MKELFTHVMSFCCTSAQSQTSLFESCPGDVPGGLTRFQGSWFGLPVPAGSLSFVSSSCPVSSSCYDFNFQAVTISTGSKRQYFSNSTSKDFISARPVTIEVKDRGLDSRGSDTYSSRSYGTRRSVTQYFQMQRSFAHPWVKTTTPVLGRLTPSGEHASGKYGKIPGIKVPNLVYHGLGQVAKKSSLRFNKTRISIIRRLALVRYTSQNLSFNKVNWKFSATPMHKNLEV